MQKSMALIVDDEQYNQQILERLMKSHGYDFVTVSTGDEALTLLLDQSNRFDVIILDKMMPGLDGFEVLKEIKKNEHIKDIPVILSTADVSREAVIEGMQLGAHHYITKPYDKEILYAIIDSAVLEYKKINDLKKSLNFGDTFHHLVHATFKFKTLAETSEIAAALSSVAENVSAVYFGLSELFINAIEHGNLEITYADKSKLNLEGTWEQEVADRLQHDNYKDRYVTVEWTLENNQVKVVVMDEGKGFNWQEYVEMKPERAFDSHGRGIALAKKRSFESIQYNETGTAVTVTFNIAS